MRPVMLTASKQVLDQTYGLGNRPTNGGEMFSMAADWDRKKKAGIGIPSLTAPRNATAADITAARANEPVGVVNASGTLGRGGDLGPR